MSLFAMTDWTCLEPKGMVLSGKCHVTGPSIAFSTFKQLPPVPPAAAKRICAYSHDGEEVLDDGSNQMVLC